MSAPSLIPCVNCGQHIKPTEAKCPFCSAARAEVPPWPTAQKAPIAPAYGLPANYVPPAPLYGAPAQVIGARARPRSALLLIVLALAAAGISFLAYLFFLG